MHVHIVVVRMYMYVMCVCLYYRYMQVRIQDFLLGIPPWTLPVFRISTCSRGGSPPGSATDMYYCMYSPVCRYGCEYISSDYRRATY